MNIFLVAAANLISFLSVLKFQVVLNEPVCVQEFSSCRALGRVFLRASGRTIALGIVTQILEDQE